MSWVLDELREHERSGALASLRLVSSPSRVGDTVKHLADLDERIRRGEWLYVSGNEAAGEAVHAALLEVLGDGAVRDAAETLRYINSS